VNVDSRSREPGFGVACSGQLGRWNSQRDWVALVTVGLPPDFGLNWLVFAFAIGWAQTFLATSGKLIFGTFDFEL
jgi:hypothetical protein